MEISRVGVWIGCALLVGIMIFLHRVRRDLSPVARGMSRYAGSDTLAEATVAFLALAGALTGLAAWRDEAQAVRLVLFAAGGLFVVAATPIGNPATSVTVTALHTLGGMAFYLGTVGAMFISPSNPGGRILNGMTALALSLFLAGAIGVPGLRPVVGLLQRGVFTLIIAWMLMSTIR